MDFTILYRVLWKPREVFKTFADKTRPEPFFLIAIIAPLSLALAHRNDLQQLISPPFLSISDLLKGFYSSLKWPFLNAIVVYLYVRALTKYNIRILPFVSAFILCLVPNYILKIAVAISGYPGYLFGLGGFFPSLKETQPLLFSLIASINPFFIWVIILWYAALNELLTISKQQKRSLLFILILFPFVVSLVWFIIAVMMFNLFNPVS